jgi:group I intron endonuclease
MASILDYNTGIYQIVNQINGKRYIGSSFQLKERKKQHLRLLDYNHPNRHLQNAYNKYGENNFKFEVLLCCDKKDLLFYEQRAINIYKMENLYNLRPKAESNLGRKNSESSIQKMKESHRGYKTSEETKRKISNALRGKKKTPDHIKKVADAVRGHKRTGEALNNLRARSEKRKGIPIHTEAFKIYIRNRNRGNKSHMFGKHGKDHFLSKPIFQINRYTNEIIKSWENATEAGKCLKTSISHIREVCSEKRKTAGGFKWKFTEGENG